MTPRRRQDHAAHTHTHAHAATRSGVYFITACTQDRRCLFGDISDGVMHLNALGEIVQSTWLQPPPRQPQGLSRGALVVMPNHIHAIVRIQASAAAPICLRDEIRAFKSLVTQRINIVLDTPGAIVWERHAHEHLLPMKNAPPPHSSPTLNAGQTTPCIRMWGGLSPD